MATTPEETFDGSTHHLTHQWGGERSITERIVAAVAEFEGEEVSSLPPIERSINPEALDTLFETTAEEATNPGCVTFSYYGYTAVVQSTGHVLLKRT